MRSKRRCSCVLQFTRLHAVSCVLHRPTSRVIHHSRLIFYTIFLQQLYHNVIHICLHYCQTDILHKNIYYTLSKLILISMNTCMSISNRVRLQTHIATFLRKFLPGHNGRLGRLRANLLMFQRNFHTQSKFCVTFLNCANKCIVRLTRYSFG